MRSKGVLNHFKSLMLIFLTGFCIISIISFSAVSYKNESFFLESELRNLQVDVALEADKLLYAAVVEARDMASQKVNGLRARHPGLTICTNILTVEKCGAATKFYIDPNKTLFIGGASRYPIILKAISSPTNAVFLVLYLISIFILNRILQRRIEGAIVFPLLELSDFLKHFRQRRTEQLSHQWPVELDEWKTIDEAVRKVMVEIDDLEAEVASKAAQDLARQVAHDIRSPLSALNIAIGTLTDISDQRKKIILAACSRISDIASDLLGKKHEIEVAQDLASITEAVIQEKNIQGKTSIVSSLDTGRDLIPKMELSDLKRIISNILDNGLESLVGVTNGKLTIGIAKEDGRAHLEFVDTGCGIPDHMLPILGKKKISFGKFNGAGNGLGILAAVAKLRENGDDLLIRSRVGEGTCVRISLAVRDLGHERLLLPESSQ